MPPVPVAAPACQRCSEHKTNPRAAHKTVHYQDNTTIRVCDDCATTAALAAIKLNKHITIR